MQDNYNRGGFIAFVGSVVFSLAFMAYIALFNKGIDLKEVHEGPTPGATAVPTTLADADVSKVTNPWVSSPDLITHGKKVFSTSCAMCHGESAKGDGPAGMALNPRPRNLVEGKWKQGGRTMDLFKTLQTGVPGSSMVSFQALPAIDRWSLVQYIRSITNDKPADDAKQLEEFAKTAK